MRCDFSGWAVVGVSVGMAYGLTPGGFERISGVIKYSDCLPSTFSKFLGNYPYHAWPKWPNLIESVNGVGANCVNKTFWSNTISVGTSIAGSMAVQYALPNVPHWFGRPGFRGPTLWQSGTAPNFNLSFFFPHGGNPRMNMFGLFDFPWGGTYVDNHGIDIALLFQQRIRFPRQGWRFFWLFTIWR